MKRELSAFSAIGILGYVAVTIIDRFFYQPRDEIIIPLLLVCMALLMMGLFASFKHKGKQEP